MEINMDMSAMVATLEKCKQGVATDGKRKALRAGGRVIQAAMKSMAPVLDRKTAGSNALPPGTLRDAIRISVAEREGELTALIGPSGKVEHVARFVEYGHRVVHGGYSKELANGKTRGPGKVSTKFVPAQPFLRPAYESSVVEAEEAMAESLAQTIEEQVR